MSRNVSFRQRLVGLEGARLFSLSVLSQDDGILNLILLGARGASLCYPKVAGGTQKVSGYKGVCCITVSPHGP